MESFAGNGSVNYYNGHPGPYSVQYSNPVAQIKFESEPYHAVEGDTTPGYDYSGTGVYPTNTYQQSYEQEFGSQAQPFYNNFNSTTPDQQSTDSQSGDKGPTAQNQASTRPAQSSSPGDSMTCDICNKAFSSNPSMRRHREIHSGQKKFSCELCGNSYTQKHNLTKHMRLHTGEKPYACTLCDKAFYIHHHLKNHMLQHTGQYPHNCEICKQGFKHRKQLVAHMKKHDVPTADIVMSPKSGIVSEDNSTSEIWADDTKKDIDEEKVEDDEEDSHDAFDNSFDEDEKTYDEHECEVCQQIFISKESLDKHMQLHSVDREFKCEECNNIFLTRAHLVRHRKQHTGETIYNCEECNVSFRWKVSLHIHMRRHNNDYKRHECTMCNKYFLARESLKKHMNTHIGASSYDCEDCGENFGHKTEYKAHLQSKHSNEDTANKDKPKCKTCHKTFSSNSSLRKHEYTHLDIKPHKCELCNISFAQKIQLRLHNKKHNGVIDPPMTPSQRKDAVKKALKDREVREKKEKDKEKPQVTPERKNAPRRARNVIKEDNSEESEEEEEEEMGEERGEESEGDEEDGDSSDSDSDSDSDDEEEDDEEEEDESQEEQMETDEKKSKWEGYVHPVCEYCKHTFKKTSSFRRHLKSCRKKHKVE